MKAAVIDIGTRATRLLIGDTDDLRQHGFSFEDYINRGDLTEAGRGIYPSGDGGYEYRVESLERTVRLLINLLHLCARLEVAPEHIYAVGTEVFRRVRNRNLLLDIIQRTTGLKVQVLDPAEEAECTFYATFISCMDFYAPGEPFMVIEQGGGSTQVTVAGVSLDGDLLRYGQSSIPELGTVLLREQFLAHGSTGISPTTRRVGTVHREVMQYAQQLIQETLARDFVLPPEAKPAKAFALGKAVTSYYKGANREIHGRPISRDQLLSEPIPPNILDKYARYAVASLLKDAESGAIGESPADIERLLEMLYGLPCYAALLDHFGLEQLRVCGTGLRYGVFFRVAHNDWRNIREFRPSETSAT